MPDTLSADPDRLLRFAVEAASLDSPLLSQAAALGAALDAVRSSCHDYCPPVPDLGGGLFDLLRDIDRLIACYAAMAMRFLAADCGDLWPPWVDPRSVFSCDLLYRDLFGGGGPDGPPPPIITLILLARFPSHHDDLGDIGDAVLGLKRWLWHSAKPAVDAAGPFLSILQRVASSPFGGRLAERLALTPAGRRVLGPLGLLSHSPLLGAAGAAMTFITIGEDVNRLVRDGDPRKAFHRKGAGYVADWAGASFDVTSAACEVAPNPWTCGAAGLSGTVWVGAEAYQHRKAIGHALELPVDAADVMVPVATERARAYQDWIFDHVPSAVGHAVDELRGQHGLWRPPSVLIPPGQEIADRLRGIMARPLAAADWAERTAADGAHTAKDVMHGGAELLGHGAGAVGRFASRFVPG